MNDAGGGRDRPLILTMGEPAGIGPEIALKAWTRRNEGIPVFALMGDPGEIHSLVGRLGLDVPLAEISSPGAAASVFASRLPVVSVPLGAPVEPGTLNRANAGAVIDSIRRAVDLVLAGEASAIVTNPIHKSVLYDAGFTYPGHTEYLAHLARSPSAPVMMLAAPNLRVVPVTVHLSLTDAIAALTTDAIVHAGRTTAAALARDFAIARPRLAVAGLNPHAGESGMLGREEIDIIAPAIARLRAEGIEASDPQPADTLFHPAARARHDAVLCMYHDQALIPLKTIDFEHGVNVTLGLPFVRTSPDHGTALALAGRGLASETSLIEALRLANIMAGARMRAEGDPAERRVGGRRD